MLGWRQESIDDLFRFIGPMKCLEFCHFPPMDCAVRGMTSWLPMDEHRRSCNRPMLRHWKSDESTAFEETSAEEDRDWNGDIDADWTIESVAALRFLEGVCALWWRLIDRRR